MSAGTQQQPDAQAIARECVEDYLSPDRVLIEHGEEFEAVLEVVRAPRPPLRR